jgi:hypothetical protein
MTEGVQAPEGKVLLHDGVGMLRRGDTCLIVYQKAARLERTRWLFDVVDEMIATTGFDLLALLIVLPSADPPDTPTHQENYLRLRRLGSRVRRLVTVPVGNEFRTSVVRAVMRGLNVILGHSGTRFVANRVDAGITRLLEVSSLRTPPASQILADVRALYLTLGESDPHFELEPGGRGDQQRSPPR